MIKACVICGIEFDARGSTIACSRGCNNERITQKRRLYRAAHKAEINQWCRRWYADNEEDRRRYYRRYYAENKEVIRERTRKREMLGRDIIKAVRELDLFQQGDTQ